ncbi:MAG: hypothetical protein OXQ84_10435 [bacterium]|nr:hypothetical protein [bacterium]
MTSDDTQARRTAEELRRRERQARQSEASMDAATFAAILEKHEGEMARIVGQVEAILAEKIDALAGARDAAAESLAREIERGRKGSGEAKETAALVRQFADEQHAAWKELSAGIKRGLDALARSLDEREGAVFAGIDRVAESVAPGARALAELHKAVAGTVTAARDVATIKEAVVDGRSAVDEVAAIRKTVADSRADLADVAAMKPVLDAIATSHGTWNANLRRLRWLGGILLVVFALAFGTVGVWLQRETAVWPTPAEVENRERDAFWERHGEQFMHCYEEAERLNQPMACTIVVMDP